MQQAPHAVQACICKVYICSSSYVRSPHVVTHIVLPMLSPSLRGLRKLLKPPETNTSIRPHALSLHCTLVDINWPLSIPGSQEEHSLAGRGCMRHVWYPLSSAAILFGGKYNGGAPEDSGSHIQDLQYGHNQHIALFHYRMWAWSVWNAAETKDCFLVETVLA